MDLKMLSLCADADATYADANLDNTRWKSIGMPAGAGDNVFSDINTKTINLEVISEIQKELETCDLISLVFLLYDVPDTALQRLIVLQRVSKDIEGNHLNLLCDWALHAQKNGGTWREQFLEALAVCQLYSVLRKIGCNNIIPIKERYSSSSHVPLMDSYINPMKIALYQVCENMTSYTFNNLKKTLDSFDLNVMQYDTCELVFLELMCQKFITVNHSDCENGAVGRDCKVEKITKIIDRYSELNHYATMLREVEKKLRSNLETASSSTQAPELKSDLNSKDGSHTKPDEFNDIYNMITELHIEDLPIDLKSDNNIFKKDGYIIKKKERVGICCIINQEVFHPSRDSMERSTAKPLDTRTGSSKDKILLEKTMRSLNFDVMTEQNLNRKEMLAFIQQAIKKVSEDDSIFMLCILSHGVKGRVYAADSVAVKVDDIQNMMDDALLLRGIPKVLILQACQVESDDEAPAFEADGPQYTLRKTDFLVCWATAPDLEAFRSPKLGSLFIQILCGTIAKSVENEHLLDIFTKVTNKVTAICIANNCDQVPTTMTTLRQKLFLHSPAENIVV